jgi:OOP family OmpA-OmpF porin
MIKTVQLLFFLALLPFYGFCNNLSGNWEGVMIPTGKTIEQGIVLNFEIDIDDNALSGFSREELFGTEFYSLKKIEGTATSNGFKFKQIVSLKSKNTSKIKWCRMEGELNYNEKTGYLTGDYISYECKRVTGKIILYQCDKKLIKEDENDVSHIWFDQFTKDYKLGLSAPKIRLLERKNFVFEPVYFDYDESFIRPEHFAFLDKMILVIKGHSDLRVLVTGHTDSDGSDKYNDDLSFRRAQAIIDYFKSKGLNEDHLEFDFKGEKNPIDDNKTSIGKQRNRRVDFKFI